MESRWRIAAKFVSITHNIAKENADDKAPISTVGKREPPQIWMCSSIPNISGDFYKFIHN